MTGLLSPVIQDAVTEKRDNRVDILLTKIYDKSIADERMKCVHYKRARRSVRMCV